MKWTHYLVLFCISICRELNGEIAPYQVSIVANEFSITDGSLEDSNLCSGAVIHERYILTTADCMHIRSDKESIPKPRSTSSLNVTAGTFDSDSNNTRRVQEIIIHEKFNYTSLENDVALLKLDEPFILNENPSIQWIELDNSSSKLENCSISFLNQTSKSYPFTSPRSTYVIDNKFCNKNLYAANYTEKDNDICSYYMINDRSLCKFQPRFFQVSRDRGAALVCNNHLSGILSQIIPPLHTSNATASCEVSLKIWAFYTRVSDYAEWINKTIAGNEYIPVNTPPPYHSSPDVEQSSTIDSSVTSGGVKKSLPFIMLTSSISLISTFMRCISM